jgi:hypothetical protein
VEGTPPLENFVTIHSKEIEVLCFDTVLQVFILDGLVAATGGRNAKQ